MSRPVLSVHSQLILLGLLLLANTGCDPDVAWLPDSSGFVYAASDWPGFDLKAARESRLYHYDLKVKSRREIARTDGSTIRPALSPDGQRLAVARVQMEQDKQPTLQVVLLDLSGKELASSKVFAWGAPPQSPPSLEKYSQLFWSPDGAKLLVYANQQPGIYDISKNEMKTLGNGFPMLQRNTPFTPDGKSILLARDGRNISLVDWDGKQTDIAVTGETGDRNLEDVLFTWGADAWVRWDGATAVATWKGGQLRVDAVKKTAIVQKADASVWAAEGKEIKELVLFPNGKTRLLVTYLMSHRDFRDAGLPSVRVEFMGAESGQRRTLIETTPHCGVFPSPNREFVALRYSAPKPEDRSSYRDVTLVINQKGEIVAELDYDKK